MKILDRYILTSFVKAFTSLFVILIFIFILQAIWLFIKDIAGKGLDVFMILRFLWYLLPDIISKVLPLTILLTSIMTFGNFAEKYEFAAMKSTGISLQRAMRSVIVFIVFTGAAAFYLANNVIPAATVKTWNMRRNLAKMKPALAISEGMFNDLGNFNIKVAKKYGENDQYLEDVIIHQKSRSKKNLIVIKAVDGELKNDEESGMLQLVLKDGNRYEEILRKEPKEQRKQPHAKVAFDEYIMNIDLSQMNNVDFEGESNIKTHKMKNIVELNKDIDSIGKSYQEAVMIFGEDIHRRSGIKSAFDSTGKKSKPTTTAKDADIETVSHADSLLTELASWKAVQVIEQAQNKAKQQRNLLNNKKSVFDRNDKLINLHQIELHKKIALGFACIILFFVGAPLGAIIRKGGLGLPMVIAIVIFLAYHFIGLFGENSAEDGSFHPILGAWLSTLIMLPFGLWVSKRATSDRGIINTDAITVPVKNFFERVAGIRKKSK